MAIVSLQVAAMAPPTAPQQAAVPVAATADRRSQPADFANMSIEDLVALVMQQSAAAETQELREEMNEMKKVAERKQAARDLLTQLAAEKKRLGGGGQRDAGEHKKSMAVDFDRTYARIPSVSAPSVASGKRMALPSDSARPAAPADATIPAAARAQPCAGRQDEDDCVLRALRARLEWVRGRAQ